MKGHAAVAKAAKGTHRPSQQSPAGAAALALTPPAYGIEFVDEAAVSGAPRATDRGRAAVRPFAASAPIDPAPRSSGPPMPQSGAAQAPGPSAVPDSAGPGHASLRQSAMTSRSASSGRSERVIQRSPADAGGVSTLPPAPTPSVAADNPLVEAMSVFDSIRPSSTTGGVYEGIYRNRKFSITQARYEQMRARVREEALKAIRHASSNAETAIGRYDEQQKVDAHHWIVAPIVKTLGRVSDPGPDLMNYVAISRIKLAEARLALDHDSFVAAAEFIGDAERTAAQASKMVLAYVDQIIGASEMTVTVLEGVKTASAAVFFLCAVAATGGAAGAGATALGLEGVAGTTTLFGVTGSTAAWATAVGTTAVIAQEVGVGIMRAADGDIVDWGAIATHAAIQIVVAKFSPVLGQRLSQSLSRAAVANPAVRDAIASVGMARVVTIGTNVLMHEGAQVFATVVEDTVKALRGQRVTWGEFGQQLFNRIADPSGLFVAALAGALGGVQPAPSRQPGGPVPAQTPKPSLPKSKSDNRDMRDLNRELGLPKPRTKTTPIAPPPPGFQPTNAETAFRPTPAERAAAYAKETPLTAAGTPIRVSPGASPRGQGFQSASMQKPSAFPRTVRADIGEAAATKAALSAGEILLEAPQGTNVGGRSDFVTAARDPSGKLWIIANDAKTRSASGGSFEDPNPGLRPRWDAQVKAAVERAAQADPTLGVELQAAQRGGRVWVRQVNVDLSPDGQGAISGVAAPAPVPWGALLGPVDLKDAKR